MEVPLNFISLALVVNLIIAPVYSVQIRNSSGAPPEGIAVGCWNALSTNITCSQLVPAYKVSQQVLYSNTDLSKLCTTTCSNSLHEFQEDVYESCGDATLSFDGRNTTAAELVDPLVWAYNVTCLQDSSGFCNPQIFNSSYFLDGCSDCVLSYIARMLESDYGRVRFNDKGFSSQLSSCGVPATKYPYTTPTSSPLSSSTAPGSASSTPTTRACSGDSYTVGEDDSCESIAEANSIPIGTFLADNGIDQNCTTLKPGSEVCLSPSCTLYKVKEGDTCKTILEGKGYYKNQLLSWNPTLRTNCDNLETVVGQGICISPPGSSTWDVTTTNRTSTMIFTMFPGDWETGPAPTQVTESPTYTALPTNFSPITSTYTVNQTAQSMIEDYSKYCPILDEDYEDGFRWEDLSDTCQDLLDPYCSPDIHSPSPKSTEFPGSCTPTVSATPTASSTPAPSPTLDGTTARCNKYHYVVANDTCPAVVKRYGITLTDFYSWNPGVGPDCRTLKTEYYVCVGVSGTSTPTNTMGTTSATATTTAGDQCFDLAKKYNITLNEFYDWNPAVGEGCKSLKTEYYVCVGVKGGTVPSTTTSKPTSTGGGTTTSPSETLPGTIETCKKYYKVGEDDGCYDIAAAHDITLKNFYAWNPSVKDDCSGLKFDTYVCVGI
ncbi:hypothetical protein N7470_006797 [Penicillium chermesinum]|nr:hypothetical protein N7470_006797 [Penicillium chermesinum]